MELIIGGLITIVIGVIAWIFKMLYQRLENIEEKADEIEHNYLSRFDDMKDTMHKGFCEIKNLIIAKLDK